MEVVLHPAQLYLLWTHLLWTHLLTKVSLSIQAFSPVLPHDYMYMYINVLRQHTVDFWWWLAIPVHDQFAFEWFKFTFKLGSNLHSNFMERISGTGQSNCTKSFHQSELSTSLPLESEFRDVELSKLFIRVSSAGLNLFFTPIPSVVWKTFGTKKFLTRSGVRKLNTRNIFYNK